MIKCPKCGETMDAKFNPYPDKDADYVEAFFTCPNGHHYFVRIKKADLIED